MMGLLPCLKMFLFHALFICFCRSLEVGFFVNIMILTSGYKQEKELIERHNVWLNDELTAKVNSFNELRRTHSEVEADMTAKLADVSVIDRFTFLRV